jgi:hypothetical protein
LTSFSRRLVSDHGSVVFGIGTGFTHERRPSCRAHG